MCNIQPHLLPFAIPFSDRYNEKVAGNFGQRIFQGSSDRTGHLLQSHSTTNHRLFFNDGIFYSTGNINSDAAKMNGRIYLDLAIKECNHQVRKFTKINKKQTCF